MGGVIPSFQSGHGPSSAPQAGSLTYRELNLDREQRHRLPTAMRIPRDQIEHHLQRLDGLLKQKGFQGWPCDPVQRPPIWCPSSGFTFDDPVLDRFWTIQKVAWHYTPSTRRFDVLLQTSGGPYPSCDLVLITDVFGQPKIKPIGYLGGHLGSEISRNRVPPGFPPWVKAGSTWVFLPEYNEQFYRPDYIVHPELGLAEIFPTIETHRSHARLLREDAAEMKAHLARGGHEDDDVAQHDCAGIFLEDLPAERIRAVGYEWMRVNGRYIALKFKPRRSGKTSSHRQAKG